MNSFRKFTIVVLVLIAATISVGFALQGKVTQMQAKMEVKVLMDGKHSKVLGDICFDATTNKVITKYTYPNKYYVVANKLGELQMFTPDSNLVRVSQDNNYSSKEVLMYLFLNHHQNDLRLKDIGCTLQDTRFEDDLRISTWTPPSHMRQAFGKIELVHKRYDPIFICYYTPRGDVYRKVYFTKYKQISTYLKMPTRTTDILYLEDAKDSIISRTEYTDIKINGSVDRTLINFQIPKDAKVIKE